MTPRSLFNIVLKILGLFLFKEIILLLPQIFNVFYFVITGSPFSQAAWVLFTTLLTIVLYWIAGYFLIFKSERIINEFKLDKGFDQETIPLNIHRSTILSISVIIIGGILIANALPEFCQNVYQYYLKIRYYYDPNAETSNMMLSGSKVVIGIILIVVQRSIVNAIEFHRKKGEGKTREKETDPSIQG